MEKTGFIFRPLERTADFFSVFSNGNRLDKRENLEQLGESFFVWTNERLKMITRC